MPNNFQEHVDEPAFEKVLAACKRPRARVSVKVRDGASITCRTEVSGNAASIDFDLWRLGSNLSEDAQRRYTEKHGAYLKKHLKQLRPKKPGITGHFGATGIHFQVLEQDASEWFDDVYAALQDSANFTPLPDPFEMLKKTKQPAETEAKKLPNPPKAPRAESPRITAVRTRLQTLQWKWSSDGKYLVLTSMSPSDHQEALAAILALEGSREIQGPIIAGRLRDSLSTFRMPLDVLEEFSKWCHTGTSYAGSQQAAERLSQMFFGGIIPRLLNQANGHTSTYDRDPVDLKSRLGVDDGTAEPHGPPSLSRDDGLTPADDGQSYVPTTGDSREAVLRQIKARRGQQGFRDGLRRRYGDKCMISGCTIMDIVEAAHIKQYRGEDDNHPENGLLLRVDLHTLFDLNLLGIEPSTLTVKIHPDGKKDGYQHLEGKKLLCGPAGPSPEAIVYRWKEFVQHGGIS
jgi:hypothetical protein